MPDGNVEAEVGSEQAVEAVPGAGHLDHGDQVHSGDHTDSDQRRHHHYH